MKSRSLISLVISLVLLLIAVPASASDATTVASTTAEHEHEHAVSEGGVVAYRYIACPGGGRCEMYSVASALLYNGSFSNPGPAISTAQAYQCSKCYQVIATQNLMAGKGAPGYAGHWSIYSPGYPVVGPYLYMYGGYMGYNTSVNNEPILSSCSWH